MTSRKDLLTSLKPHGSVLILANGGQVRIQAAGSIQLDLRISTGDVIPATIHDVFYVRELKGGNLISESQLELNGCKIISGYGRRKVFTGGKEWILGILDSSGQYAIQENSRNTSFASYLHAHKCFGHPSQTAMENSKKLYPNIISNQPAGFHCPFCQLSKSTHRSEKSSQKRAKYPQGITHSDLSGKFSVESFGGKRYYIIFIDDYSRYAWVYFLRDKSDAYQAIREFMLRIRN
ncbi:hypothetical protein K3495_g10069 [Podosphaera aphanis]|nr:hypothetical protein K3495_g10069 [Podosphaera aphanis]